MNLVPARKYLSAACTLVALAAVGASPALAKTTHHKTTQSSQQLYLSAPENSGGSVVMDKAREQAIRDCSAESNKWSMSSWQSNQILSYGECMAQHGQPQ